jgi:hypothetical protein
MSCQRRYLVITDLTRLKSDGDTVCTAGVDLHTGESLRPYPYFTKGFCKTHGILPGVKISALFAPTLNRAAPHSEDSLCNNLQVEGSVPSENFHEILRKYSVTSLMEGFRTSLPRFQKYFPKDIPPPVSLVTLQVKPDQIHLHPGQTTGSIRLNLGGSGRMPINEIPITDLRFHALLRQNPQNEFYIELNRELHRKEEVFLRVGLGRCYTNQQGKEGFWLQVNGIYTFPEKLSTLPQNPF